MTKKKAKKHTKEDPATAVLYRQIDEEDDLKNQVFVQFRT